MNIKDRGDNFRQRMSRLFGKTKLPGILGTGQGTIVDPLLPLTNVMIRVQSSNGLSTPRSAILPSAANLEFYDGEPIWLGWDNFKNRYTVLGPNADAKASIGRSTASVVSAQNSSSTPQSDFETLRLIAKTGLLVSLKPWNIISGSVYTEFQFPDIDLTSYVPSSGNMLYALIGILADLSNVEIAISTARSIASLPLGPDDVNEAIALLTAGSTPAWAVKLIGGQTEVTQDEINSDAVDLRQIVNASDAVHATVSTTNATATTLYTFTCPASTTFAVNASVVARRTGGGAGTAEDGAYYERVVAVKNVAGTATIIGSIASLVTIEDVAGYDATFDVTGATLRVRVTGVVSTNIDWKMTAYVNQVS